MDNITATFDDKMLCCSITLSKHGQLIPQSTFNEMQNTLDKLYKTRDEGKLALLLDQCILFNLARTI